MAAAREGNLDALKVKFTHSNTVRDKKPYTIYEIEVRSSSTITWVIYKRYNDFFTLHQQLTKWKEAASASSPNSSVAQLVLPTLPPKRLTRSLAVEFVEKRKAELQEYLREVLASPGLQRTEVVLNFLEVPDSVRPMLARGSANQDATSDSDARDGLGDGKDSLYNTRNYQHRSPDERKVLDLLNSLGFSRNKVSAIKVFEDWFFELKPRLPPDCIRTLFQGEPVGDLEGGLVQACGDFKYSHVASRAALDLLVRLLDVEKNKDAQSFLDVFCTLELASLQRMQLHLHILSERGNRLGAFKLVSTLKSKLNDSIVEKVVSDPYARQEYFRWAERKSESITPALSEPQETAMRAVNLAEVGHRKVSEQAFQDILAIAHNEQGWRVVRFHRLPAELCLKQMPRPASGSVASPPPPEPADASNMRLTFKIDQRRDIVIVRASAALPFSVDTVTKFLLEIPRRTDWDIMFHRGKRVDKLDSTSDVVHFVFKSFCSPFKYRDFCLLRAWTKLESGGRIIATRSVMHPKLPEQKDHVRAVLLPTGYMVTPLEDGPADAKDSRGGCLLTFVGQFDKDSVLIVSPDLLGETNMLYQSFENLKLCLQAQGPAVVPPAPSPKGSAPSAPASSPLSPRASPTPLSAQQSPVPTPTQNKIAGITAMFGKK